MQFSSALRVFITPFYEIVHCVTECKHKDRISNRTINIHLGRIQKPAKQGQHNQGGDVEVFLRHFHKLKIVNVFFEYIKFNLPNKSIPAVVLPCKTKQQQIINLKVMSPFTHTSIIQGLSTFAQDTASYLFPQSQEHLLYSDNMLFTLWGVLLVIALVILRVFIKKKKTHPRNPK